MVIEDLARAGDREAMQTQLLRWREENLDRYNLRDVADP
ncbi:hypothetical protein OP10G_3992 [Fimbriimonas ginsengisoli Gsoil 348]|uniref:Uncharacterized protein n=1 Tax=Fimbriimonas ginsengisoli Gsoil 348 TaxID=661478 RepID=A0A068NX46_FIMGI|nr:hypothetical protein OP10G_3992 [Fimbriimonas ginsengisoli Gsoil 348]